MREEEIKTLPTYRFTDYDLGDPNQNDDQPFDIDKLARAVAQHETKNCGLDYGSSAQNNCFGIGKFKGGKRIGFKYFESPEESYKDFKRIWNNYYGGLPDIHKAKKYSGNDRAEEWLNNVLYFYNTL